MNERNRDVESMLRIALDEAAAQVQPAAPRELPAASSSRPRWLLAAAGLVVVLGAVGIGAFLASRGEGVDGINVASEATPGRLRTHDEIPAATADLEVFMNVDATTEEIDAVRALIDGSADVGAYTYVDRVTAYHEFTGVFCANPDVVRSIRPGDLPVTFRVVALEPAAIEQLDALFSTQPGVDQVTQPAKADHQGGPASNCSAVNVEPNVEPDVEATTTVPSMPPAGEAQPDETAATRDAVIAAYQQAYTGTNSVDVRRAAVEDAEELEALLDQARAQNIETVTTLSIEVGDVTFLDATRAAVIYRLSIGATWQPWQLGYAQLDAGTWRVSRETTCAGLQQGGIVCPPRSE